MRTFAAGVLASALVLSSTFSYAAPSALLPAGKPAGVKEAALLGPNFILILLSAGILIGGLAMTASGNSNNGVTTPTTSSTSTRALP